MIAINLNFIIIIEYFKQINYFTNFNPEFSHLINFIIIIHYCYLNFMKINLAKFMLLVMIN